MDRKYHVISLTVHNKDKVYKEVSELLHSYAESICLRVGYPIKERNIAIIFLVMNASTDLIGALTGKLGQLSSVKVKATVIKE
jgi:putative iron-only hydrogenase system regulator